MHPAAAAILAFVIAYVIFTVQGFVAFGWVGLTYRLRQRENVDPSKTRYDSQR